MSRQEPINGLAPIHENLRGVLEVYQTAEDALLERIPVVQAECSHPQVLHADYKYLEYFSSLMPLRMCACCRIEEEGSLWSDSDRWNVRGYETPTLGNAPHRLVVAVERDQIYNLRLPGPRYLANKARVSE